MCCFLCSLVVVVSYGVFMPYIVNAWGALRLISCTCERSQLNTILLSSQTLAAAHAQSNYHHQSGDQNGVELELELVIASRFPCAQCARSHFDAHVVYMVIFFVVVERDACCFMRCAVSAQGFFC